MSLGLRCLVHYPETGHLDRAAMGSGRDGKAERFRPHDDSATRAVPWRTARLWTAPVPGLFGGRTSSRRSRFFTMTLQNPPRKRWRPTALQDAAATSSPPRQPARFWSAPGLWRFGGRMASRRAYRNNGLARSWAAKIGRGPPRFTTLARLLWLAPKALS